MDSILIPCDGIRRCGYYLENTKGLLAINLLVVLSPCILIQASAPAGCQQRRVVQVGIAAYGRHLSLSFTCSMSGQSRALRPFACVERPYGAKSPAKTLPLCQFRHFLCFREGQGFSGRVRFLAIQHPAERCRALQSVYLLVVCVFQPWHILVQVCLLLLEVVSEAGHDCSVETFHFAVGLEVKGGRPQLLISQACCHGCKELQDKLQSVYYS